MSAALYLAVAVAVTFVVAAAGGRTLINPRRGPDADLLIIAMAAMACGLIWPITLIIGLLAAVAWGTRR